MLDVVKLMGVLDRNDFVYMIINNDVKDLLILYDNETGYIYMDSKNINNYIVLYKLTREIKRDIRINMLNSKSLDDYFDKEYEEFINSCIAEYNLYEQRRKQAQEEDIIIKKNIFNNIIKLLDCKIQVYINGTYFPAKVITYDKKFELFVENKDGFSFGLSVEYNMIDKIDDTNKEQYEILLYNSCHLIFKKG